MKIRILLFACLFLLISCRTQTTAPVANNNTVTIEINKKVKIPNANITLEFANILEDSRCPANVNCVWQGIAILDIHATSQQAPANFELATMDFEPKKASQSFSYAGYRFTLQSLTAQPGSKDKTPIATIGYTKE